MNTEIFKCFIASPSDTQYERDVCETVFAEINKTIGSKFNFRLESLRWEYDTHPDFGNYSQEVVSQQLGNKYQIFIDIYRYS